MHDCFAQPRSIARRAILGISGVCLAHLALANDNSPGVTPSAFSTLLGGTPRHIAIAQTSVQITGQQVNIALTPRAPVPEQATLLVRSPLFGWLGESDPYPDRHFPELSFSSNGLPLTASDSFQAFVGTTDVSALLRQAGVNPWLIADTPPFVPTEGMQPDVLAKLVHIGILTKVGDDYLAQWHAQRTLSTALSAGQAIAITYRLRPAYSLWPKRALVAANLLRRHCVSGAQVLTLVPGSATATQLVVKQYAIPVAVDGRPPTSVRLSVAPQPGVDLVATCASRGTGIAGARGLTDIAVKPDRHGVLSVLTVEHSAP